MRSLEQARSSWQELAQYASVRELKNAVRFESRSSAATRGLRSFCWKTFLLFDTLDSATHLKTLASSRSAYNTLRAHFLRLIDNPDDVGSGFDPLSQDAEASPWALLRKDEELRVEILQDVERCMPEHDYFRNAEVQRTLLDILFVFCKLNPDVGYRQGMHEVLAPILWVVQGDAVDFGQASKALGDDAVIANMFDAGHVEHDTFAIFGQIMQRSKPFYASDGPGSIAGRSRHIFDDLLPQVDPDLKKHLHHLDVVPQVYLIRWIRLLFGREFDFNSILVLWDAIFAEDPALELVNYICVAMLLRIRWDLLDADYNGALTLLLRYPEPDRDFPAQTLVFDAIALRRNLSRESGNSLVLKYTGRPLLRAGRPVTPPALQRNITAFSGFTVRRSMDRKGALSPSRAPLQARNLEAMLRNTAKSIHARGERLGIGKAVRSAVEEVHRKAQEIRETQVSSPPPSWRRNQESSQPVRASDRVQDLENRNKQLSELLAGAVNELWDYQKSVTEANEDVKDAGREDRVDKLSAAIAKVQFVQVYLDEPSLALAEESSSDTQEWKAGEEGLSQETQYSGTGISAHEMGVTPQAHIMDAAQEEEAAPPSPQIQDLADPASFEDFGDPHNRSEHNEAVQIGQAPDAAAPVGPRNDTSRKTAEATAPRQSRPPLAQSEFSFMLGQNDGKEHENRLHPFDTTNSSNKREPTKGSLFGGSQDGRSTPPNQGQLQSEHDAFDIGSLRRAPRAPR